jgi:hypothetical protein
MTGSDLDESWVNGPPLEETLKRYPAMEMAGPTTTVENPFINQLKTLPVRLFPAS